MSTKSRAAILVEPNQPLVVDTVEIPDPAPDRAQVASRDWRSSVLMRSAPSSVCAANAEYAFLTPT